MKFPPILDATQTELAKAEGWELALVIDNGKSKPAWKILALPGAFRNAVAAQTHVVQQARQRSTLHVTALRAVVQP